MSSSLSSTSSSSLIPSFSEKGQPKTKKITRTPPGVRRINSKNATPSHPNLSKVIRQLVWNKYVGEKNGLGKCWCCHSKTISSFEFEAGHVVARANGGEDTVENLRPICSLCNKSMGKENMLEYQKRQKLGPSPSTAFWENMVGLLSYIPIRFGWG